MPNRGVESLDDALHKDSKGKNYLLAIGINQYKHWNPLNNAVKDVRDFIRVLKIHYQFDDAQIITLYDGAATMDNIYKKLDKLVDAVEVQDNLLIYFSGHGHYDDRLREGYWVPVDAKKDAVSSYISNSNLVQYLSAIQSHHTFLIVDSCFSGTLMSQLRSGVRSERYPSKRIFASGRTEVVDDGIAGQNSPFATGIINYLKRNTDRAVKTTTLIEFVKEYMDKQSTRQTPVDGRIVRLGDEGGEFVFHLKKSEEEIWQQVKKENSLDSYKKYLSYFPHGLYVEQAQEGIHILREDEIWQSAKRKNSTVALYEYIREYPDGKYKKEAFELLETIEEEEAWADAQRVDSLSGYMSYLTKYPEGRFADTANKLVKKREANLRETAGETRQRKAQQALWQQREKEAAIQKREFREAVNKAEQLFAKKEFAAAKPAYMEALTLHRKGLEPDEAFLKERLAESKKFEEFLDLYGSGRRAFDKGNFELALQYFDRAATIHSNQKLQNTIAVTKQQLRMHGNFSTKKIKQPKKSSGWIWVLVATFAVLIMAMIVFAVANYENDNTDGMAANSEETSSEVLSNDGSLPASPEAPVAAGSRNFSQAILGSWMLDDVESNSPEVAQLFSTFIGSYYEFYNNGYYSITNEYTGTTQAPYRVNGSNIQMNTLYGIIEEMTSDEMVIFTQGNEGGYYYEIRLYYLRE